MERKQKKIKILFTIPNFDTAGSGKALLNIAKRLDRTRFDSLICSRKLYDIFINWLIDDAFICLLRSYSRIKFKRVGTGWKVNIFQYGFCNSLYDDCHIDTAYHVVNRYVKH